MNNELTRRLAWLAATAAVLFTATRLQAAAADELIVTVNVTASGQATIGTVMSDQCEVQLTARLVFKPDPATGRYKEPSEEQYTVAASGAGHILDIESWSYSEKVAGPGTVSLTYMPSQGKAVIGWRYLDELILSTPEAGQGAERMARTALKMAEDNYIMQEDSGVVRFEPNAAAFNASGSGSADHSDMLSNANITANFSLSRGGDGPVEAVILPPQHYDSWIPEAGPDHVFPGPTPVEVRVELRMAGTTAPPPVRKAKFRFQLLDGSKEPGLCLNTPPKDEARDDFDLGFALPGGFMPPNQAQTLETERFTTDAVAVVLSYDYGAYAKVRVTAILDTGQEIEAFVENHPDQKTLTLPKDENHNRIADAWEKNEGTWGEVQDPAWDEANDPDDHEANGDGISLYEKYRGFKFGKFHERLKAKKKHLFVYDPDNAVRLNLESDSSFETASKLRVRFLSEDTWTGPGPAGSDKRIVNFNTSGFGHAVDQHGLHVRVVPSNSPTVAQDFQDLWIAKYGGPLSLDISSYYGFTYHDVTGGAWPDAPRSAFAIELYPAGFARICREYVRYHTGALPLFDDYASAPPLEQAWLTTEWKRLADDYILTHPAEWGAQNHMYFMAGISHELGHGVGIDDLVPPHNGGPWTCYMRYLDWDFPRDTSDRMELQARWNNPLNRPQGFCLSSAATTQGKACYKQIHVTDRQGKGTLSPPRDFVATPLTRPAASAIATVTPHRSHRTLAAMPLPALQVTAETVWDPVLAGDPLRILVRLNSPAANHAWTQTLQQGQRQGAPAFPTIAPGWPTGLRLELLRLRPDGTRTTLLSPEQWAAQVRPISEPTDALEQQLGTWAREFLTDASAAALEPGDYALAVSWNGRGLADDSLLPPDGIVAGEDLLLRVSAPADDLARARQLRRLAFGAWDRGQWTAAREHGQQALLLAPADTDREAVDNLFVVASANLGLKDYLEVARSLNAVATSPTGRAAGELRLHARRLLDALVPSVRLLQAGTSDRPARLEVLGHPGQTYEVQASTDLRTWTTADRRTASANRYAITEAPIPAANAARFYRVLWLP